MQLVTPVGTANFAFVFRPQKPMQEGQEPKFSLTLSWPEGSKKLDPLRKAIEDVAVAKWGAKAKQMLEKGQLKSPLRRGDEVTSDAFEGQEFLAARSPDKPQVVDQDLDDIFDELDFYSGCKARMDIYLFAYDKAGNKGVSAILNSAQKVSEGDRISGRRSASEAFGGDNELTSEEAALL